MEPGEHSGPLATSCTVAWQMCPAWVAAMMEPVESSPRELVESSRLHATSYLASWCQISLFAHSSCERHGKQPTLQSPPNHPPHYHPVLLSQWLQSYKPGPRRAPPRNALGSLLRGLPCAWGIVSPLTTELLASCGDARQTSAPSEVTLLCELPQHSMWMTLGRVDLNQVWRHRRHLQQQNSASASQTKPCLSCCLP